MKDDIPLISSTTLKPILQKIWQRKYEQFYQNILPFPFYLAYILQELHNVSNWEASKSWRVVQPFCIKEMRVSLKSFEINSWIHLFPGRHDPITWKYHKIESKVAPWKRLVGLPDNFLETIKGMRGSPSVDSQGNICKINAFGKRLTKKESSLRNIDSVFPDHGAKMLSHNLYLPKSKGKWILNWHNKEYDLSLSP
jgi:hypothetical protein